MLWFVTLYGICIVMHYLSNVIGTKCNENWKEEITQNQTSAHVKLGSLVLAEDQSNEGIQITFDRFHLDRTCPESSLYLLSVRKTYKNKIGNEEQQNIWQWPQEAPGPTPLEFWCQLFSVLAFLGEHTSLLKSK